MGAVGAWGKDPSYTPVRLDPVEGDYRHSTLWEEPGIRKTLPSLDAYPSERTASLVMES